MDRLWSIDCQLFRKWFLDQLDSQNKGARDDEQFCYVVDHRWKELITRPGKDLRNWDFDFNIISIEDAKSIVENT